MFTRRFFVVASSTLLITVVAGTDAAATEADQPLSGGEIVFLDQPGTVITMAADDFAALRSFEYDAAPIIQVFGQSGISGEFSFDKRLFEFGEYVALVGLDDVLLSPTTVLAEGSDQTIATFSFDSLPQFDQNSNLTIVLPITAKSLYPNELVANPLSNQLTLQDSAGAELAAKQWTPSVNTTSAFIWGIELSSTWAAVPTANDSAAYTYVKTAILTSTGPGSAPSDSHIVFTYDSRFVRGVSEVTVSTTGAQPADLVEGTLAAQLADSNDSLRWPATLSDWTSGLESDNFYVDLYLRRALVPGEVVSLQLTLDLHEDVSQTDHIVASTATFLGATPDAHYQRDTGKTTSSDRTGSGSLKFDAAIEGRI